MSTPSSRRDRRRQGRNRLVPYLFVLPNMLVFGLFTIWPAISGFNVSLYDSSNGRTFEFVGMDNYTNILSDSEYLATVRNTLVFVVGFVVVVTLCATLLALLLNHQRRGGGALRAAYFLPVIISPVVVGLVWNWMLTRGTGVVNVALDGLGLGQPGWLLEPSLAMIAIIGVGVWVNVGFFTMILLAGLQSIDPTLYEAAKIDGANVWQQNREITLPLLRPSMLVVVILATITGFQAFDYIWTLTGGGPVGATTLMVQFIYENAFESPIQYGLASAAGVIFFIVVFGVTALNYLVGRRRGAI
ncbi:MAG TPA: sugar ABC transporter permease [Nocardioidaceae bacterium]|nr:sugar ABC transporter permease [Nocardioidaceae bacterium]